MLTNGITGPLFGPQEGCCNNSFLLNTSGLLEKCTQYVTHEGSDPTTHRDRDFFQLFGDLAYGPGECTEAELELNTAMAGVQIEVEYGFEIITNTWQFLNAGWKMFGILFTNVMDCFHPNQVSQYFYCKSPTLEEYFHH
ncbi:hypothetical protein C8Q75DRAFT_791022 [Abortiporus biennis]|nr:hypothetical protein C8Q75DRAFT_791022 [Abortiporus biennis]